MKMTKALTKVLSSLLCLLLVAALATGMMACTNETADGSSDISSTDSNVPGTPSENSPEKVGEGKTEFAFRVTDKDGNSTDFIVCTDKTVVGEALLDAKLIEGEEGQYGLYVKKVNGIVADYDIDQTYWGFLIDGEYAMTGVDQTNIEAGKTYEFKVSK